MRFWLGLAIGLVVGIPAGNGSAPQQAVKSDEVQFETADKVQLRGTFYPSAKAKAPCVMLLHRYGGNRQLSGWDDLAQRLTADFAVLSFDFRGHGDSQSVGTEFWRTPANMAIKGASRMPSKISYKDFPPSYLPMLANDVAAARRYLDRQNDTGACNSSNIVVIGADEGAALGALWMASEYQRPRLVRNSFGRWYPDPQRHMEGEDIRAAVWLSIPRMLNNNYVGSWLRGPQNKVRDTPMVFFYGSEDQRAASAASALAEELKRSGRAKPEYLRLKPKDTKVSGEKLLIKSLETDSEISAYLVNVFEKKGIRPTVPRETENSPPLSLIPLQYLGVAYR
jgi:pimeloyl-ACP methyl ester carboxylesterase